MRFACLEKKCELPAGSNVRLTGIRYFATAVVPVRPIRPLFVLHNLGRRRVANDTAICSGRGRAFSDSQL